MRGVVEQGAGCGGNVDDRGLGACAAWGSADRGVVGRGVVLVVCVVMVLCGVEGRRVGAECARRDGVGRSRGGG